MFLNLAHTRLNLYSFTRKLTFHCYLITKLLPPEEKFNMVQQIRRAALSVHLNLSEGCSRKSDKERKRYYEIARGSIIEIDAALDVALDLGYITHDQIKETGECLLICFQMLSNMIKKIDQTN